MKTRFALVSSLAIMALSSLSHAQAFPKYGVQLRDRMPLNEMPGTPSAGAGCTGYVSPSGREYAIMGVRNGTVIIEVTNPAVPVALEPAIPGPSSTWHENAVLGNYGYFVVDGN